MKSVMLSIQPKWCELIANGKKTIEVRKTKPTIDYPFKCYIYCTHYTNSNDLLESHYNGKIYQMNSKVIGEFVCDKIIPIDAYRGDSLVYNDYVFPVGFSCKDTCLTINDLCEYGKMNGLYGWHISELKIYDEPKKLSEFKLCKPNHKLIEKNQYIARYREITHLMKAPQSWCYVQDLSE